MLCVLGPFEMILVCSLTYCSNVGIQVTPAFHMRIRAGVSFVHHSVQ